MMSAYAILDCELTTPLDWRVGASIQSWGQARCQYSSCPRPRKPFSVVVACTGQAPIHVHKTCRNCKKQFNPQENHSRACRYHSAHFGGETKRKFESVYKGGTMNTAGGGEIFSYWHCCGSEDPFDPGCLAAPHVSYDD